MTIRCPPSISNRGQDLKKQIDAEICGKTQMEEVDSGNKKLLTSWHVIVKPSGTTVLGRICIIFCQRRSSGRANKLKE